MSRDVDRESVTSIFVAEAREGITTLWTALHPDGHMMPTKNMIQEQYVIGHKLKEAALLYGYPGLAKLGRALEMILEQASAVSETDWPRVVSTLRELVKIFRAQLEVIGCGGQENIGLIEEWTRRCAELMPSPPASGHSVAADPDVESLAPDYLVPNLDAEALSYFMPEAQEYLEVMEGLLLRLEQTPEDAESFEQLFRTVHTLKGSAYTVGFQAIGDLTHRIEDFMGAVRDGRTQVRPGHIDIMLRAVDVVRVLMRRDLGAIEQTRARFAAVLRDLKQLGPLQAARGQEENQCKAEPSGGVRTDEQPERPEVKRQKSQEPKGQERPEGIRVSRDRLERLLSLVGELVIGCGRLEQHLIVLEQSAHQVVASKNRLVDSVRTFEEKRACSYDPPRIFSGLLESPASAFAGSNDFRSLEFDKYDDFNFLARCIGEVTANISESMSQFSGSIRQAREDMSQLQQLTLGMRDEIARACMVPIGSLFARFRRATREMARTTGKEVTLVACGEQTYVDAGIAERLVDPLIHLVRNAVYHGIEPTTVRIAMGKPAQGTVSLGAAHRGNSLIIEVEDDGAGLDVDRIRDKAVALGLIRPESAHSLPESEVIKFILHPGFSTVEQVGDQAGRGVGLDVVKRVVETMNGHLDIESVRGVRTKFTLQVPLTLLVATPLMVRV